MKYQILTIFPELFEAFSRLGLVGRAVSQGQIELSCLQLRDFAINSHGQVDDTPYGGGSGMVLRCETAEAAIAAAKRNDPSAKVVLFTPRGRVFNQAFAKELVREAKHEQHGLIFLCSRYEGVDERVAENFVDYEICLGDFVMMGGEVCAMACIEATSRLLPGVLGNPESIAEESFESGLLEYPQYTKPAEFEGFPVPEVLLSGHHLAIAKWRAERALLDTKQRRPDLYQRYAKEGLGGERRPRHKSAGELSVALIHYPVQNKEGKVITSSITNLDLHDIARSARTFGLDRYYVVHPTRALRRLMQKVCEHWESGYGLQYNPNRSDALELISIVPDFDDVLLDIESRTGELPAIITTSARASADTISFETLRLKLEDAKRPHLLLLGTGWGMADELMSRADYRLEPIEGFSDYNHLSVRAAAAIIFDRLCGA